MNRQSPVDLDHEEPESGRASDIRGLKYDHHEAVAVFKMMDMPKTARMAELVDALVSNTSGSNTVPVRPRLRVQKQSESEERER